nr:OmcA/MtrC family decaheme c-type cytochrome [Candidatus Hydrogenedentota bacterium]
MKQTTLSLTMAAGMLVALLCGCPLQKVTVTVTPSWATLAPGESLTLTVSSTDPDDAPFSWFNSNPAAATINGATGLSIVVTAVATGTTEITVTGSASGMRATAVISVPEQPEEGQMEGEIEGEGADEGEEEGETPPANPLLPKGLNVTINSVTVPADLKPEVVFTATNDRGDLIPMVELTSVRFLIAYLETPEEGSTARFISYNTRMENPDGVANSGDEAVQATYDSAQLAGLTANEDGTFTYKFRTALPSTYNPATTHAVGGQFARLSALDGVSYPADCEFEFRPDGAALAATRDIVDTATCNECHTRMGFHGGGRRQVKLCILCHNTGTTDANSGNTVDMPVMIHKIHRGENLPSVLDGVPYQIYGHQNTLYDYSHIVFPQDIRNCTACHKQDSKASMADVYLTKPTQAGCASCHDRTWFGDPTATPEGYENHPFDFIQNDDSQCKTCHTPSAPGVSPIDAAHFTIEQMPENPGLDLALTQVTANPEDGTLTINYTAKWGDGTPVTALADVERVGAIVAWPASDYQTYKSEGIRGSRPAPGTIVNDTSPTGEYSYIFAAKLPVDPGITFGIAMTGRKHFTDANGEEQEQGLEDNSLQFFTVDGSEPQPRRQVVDDALCAKCHGGVIRGHGEQRLGVGVCVMCHNPAMGEINLKDMLHKWHTGEELSHEF